ncbi:pentapeptide repeat-containing protein [Streptomyces spororaveus]|uniref:pentapeptide repeat-containing protein n=1 Tax=Streptomyces spororaveus TaxID=284039 RepID=UPI0036942B38
MVTRTFGLTTITLPELDEPGLYLSNVDSLDGYRGTVPDFAYGDADLRSLGLAETQLVTGRIACVRAKRVEFEGVNLHGVEIGDSELGSAHWTGSKLTRVHFRDCKLMGTGRYRNTDLRENDLSAIRGVANLAKVRIDPGQQSDLAEALVHELDIIIGDD